MLYPLIQFLESVAVKLLSIFELCKYHRLALPISSLVEFSSWMKLSSVQSLSHVQLFATPLTAACQASLSISKSHSLLKLVSVVLVMPSNRLIHCRSLLLPHSIFPSIRVFLMSQFFTSSGQSIRVSASTSVLSVNIQDWFPLGWTGWISLQSKGLSRVFSTPQFKSISS